MSRGGGQPLKALLELGYTGAVYPVNPKYENIGGVRCYSSMRAIDGVCDLAVIALPAAAAIDAVIDCAAKGIRFAVVYGGGFREAGEEGEARERAYRVAPFDTVTARAMIAELRGAAILSGVRGAQSRDIEALAETVSSISHMAWMLRDSLLELDINPLFVRAVGEGVVAGDALAVVTE